MTKDAANVVHHFLHNKPVVTLIKAAKFENYYRRIVTVSPGDYHRRVKVIIRLPVICHHASLNDRYHYYNNNNRYYSFHL
jgi:hypothetical protein